MEKNYGEEVVFTNGDIADQLEEYTDKDYKLFDDFLKRFGTSNIDLSTAVGFVLTMFEESIMDTYKIGKRELNNNIEPDILKTVGWCLEILREALLDE